MTLIIPFDVDRLGVVGGGGDFFLTLRFILCERELHFAIGLVVRPDEVVVHRLGLWLCPFLLDRVPEKDLRGVRLSVLFLDAVLLGYGCRGLARHALNEDGARAGASPDEASNRLIADQSLQRQQRQWSFPG